MAPTLPAGAYLAGFRLDEAHGALLAPDGTELPLRPKTFALLQLLLRHRGELVGRQQILDEVWAGVTVTDDNVTQCIGEIRRALGEAGGRLLRTVPKRGYVLAAEEAEAPRPAPPGRQVRPWRPVPLVVWPSIALLLVLAMGAMGWANRSQQPAPSPIRLTSGPSEEARRFFDQGRTMAYHGKGGRAENWLGARRLFEQAIAADPDFAEAYAQAVFTHTNMVTSGLSGNRSDDPRRAAALAEEAVRLAPNLPVTSAAQAAVLRLQRRPAQALEAYRRTVLLDPGQHPSRANIGLMLVLTGHPGDAAAPILQAMAMADAGHPFTGTWLTYLGIAELQLGEADFGAARFRQSLRYEAFLPPDRRRLYLAAALALQGSVEEAGVLVGEVLTRSPRLTRQQLRQDELSDDPAYLANQSNFYRGLGLAGLPE